MELRKIHHQTPHEIEVINDQFLGLEPEQLIIHGIISVQDRSLHMSGVNCWVVQIYCLAIFHLIQKENSPMCGDFKEKYMLLSL